MVRAPLYTDLSVVAERDEHLHARSHSHDRSSLSDLRHRRAGSAGAATRDMNDDDGDDDRLCQSFCMNGPLQLRQVTGDDDGARH